MPACGKHGINTERARCDLPKNNRKPARADVLGNDEIGLVGKSAAIDCHAHEGIAIVANDG